MKLRTLGLAILASAVIQTVWVGKMITDRAAILRDGTEVLLETGFVDPRDLFRGHYVTLNLEISQIDAIALGFGGAADLERDTPIWVSIEKGDNNFWRPTGIHLSDPDGLLAIRGNFRSSWDNRMINIDFPFDRYFAPHERALELEDLRQEQRLGIVLAVMPDGSAAVKGIVIDGEPIYDEPIY